MADGLPTNVSRTVVTPSSIADDGGNRAIASAYGSIAQAARSIGDALRRDEEKSGAKEAQDAFNKAAAETPAGDRVATPERKGGLLDKLGVRGASYENTIGLLTLQRAEKDGRLRLAEIASENPLNPEAFQAAADQWAGGYLESAPSEHAASMNRILSDMIDEAHSRIVINRESADRQEARQGVDASIQSLQDEMDDILDENGLAGFREPGFLEKQARLFDLLDIKADSPDFVYSPEQRALDQARIIDGMQVRAAGVTVVEELKDALDFEGVGAAKSKLKEIIGSEEFQALNAGVRRKLELAGERTIEEREREIKRAIAERNREVAEYQTSNYQDLLIGMLKDGKGLSDIESAYDDGKISKGHYVSLLQQTSKRDREGDKLIEAQDLLNSDVPLDPTNSDHRNAVDRVFKNVGGEEQMKQDPVAGLDTALVFTMTHGVVPASAVAITRGLIANGTTEQQGQALDSVSRLLEEAPQAARAAFKDGEIAEAVYYSDLVKTGAPPEFAMTSIMKAREAKFDGAAKTRRDAGAKLAKDLIGREDTMKALGLKAKASPVAVFGGAETVDAAERSFRNLFTEHYSTHGDEARAKRQAAEVLKSHFGKTSVTGVERAMPYPPEAFYSVPGADPKWMGRQLQKEVSARVGEDVGLKNIQLISDSETASQAQAGASPTYKVVLMRPDGVLEAVEERFQFDPGAAEIGVLLDNAYAVEKAEQDRVRRAYMERQPTFFAGGAFSATDRRAAAEARLARQKELAARKDDPNFQAGELPGFQPF